MALGALKLPPVEELAPPANLAELYASGQKIELTREELHRKILAARTETVEATRRMRRELETKPPTADQLEAIIDELERQEAVAKGFLEQHKETRAAIVKVLAVVPPDSKLARYYGQGSLEDVDEEIESYREVCIAYRDLRWAMIALHALIAEIGTGKSFSTYEEYLAITGRS